MRVTHGMATLAVGFIVALADQVTKVLVRQHLLIGEVLPVIPGLFNLSHLRNTGAVWGILQQKNEWLALFSLVVLLLIVVLYRSLVDKRWSHSIAMGFLAGGICGNLIDRIKFGWVTDFLDFYWSGRHWPCFNIADAAICAGVGIYIISSLFAPAGRNADGGLPG